MRSVAFVTYNTVGEGLSSGWHNREGRRALVLQNTKGQRLASTTDPKEDNRVFDTGTDPEVQAVARRRAENRMEQVELLWRELEKELPMLDHAVIYLSTNGSQRAIELAQGLDPKKLTFVTCDCGFAIKQAMVLGAGLVESGRVMCECGGHETMGMLFEIFMSSGVLDTLAVA